ncbi:MAG: HAMP domain-containing sensor histidine kinase [candidate division KSB1 bacterium]|nr:HAMP domain-containing sensor histidine kinase [candidate division KSB1 bacterium]
MKNVSCHRIQRMNSGNRNEVILLESRPEKEMHKESAPREHNLQLLSSFAAQLAHDIGNPLTGLMGYVNLMRNDLNQATTQQDILGFQEKVDNIQHEINRIRKILEGVRLIKVHDTDQVEEHNLRQILERSIAIAEFKRPHKSVHISTRFSEDLPSVYLCELNIENAFTELLKYALEFAGQTGGVHVNIRYTSEQSEFEFCIQIKASPDADLKAMTASFNQQKSFKKKVNMGLLQAFASIYNHGGRLSMRNREGEADIVVKLPRVPSKA